MRTVILAVIVAAALAAPIATAQSGASGASQSAPGVGPAISPRDAALFSKQIERDLANRGARVALVFRTGFLEGELPEGLSYTHGAFWVHQTVTTTNDQAHKGYAVYNLYNGKDGDPAVSYLHQDFPYDFTQVMAQAKAGIIIPSREMQRRILQIMASPDYAGLHNPNYSLVANPHNAKYQNCNEFYLDVISAAAWETTDKSQLKVNLQSYFSPAEIKTSPLQRLFGPMFAKSVRMDDQTGGVRTTTFRSLAAFMESYNLSTDAYELTYTPETPGEIGMPAQ